MEIRWIDTPVSLPLSGDYPQVCLTPSPRAPSSTELHSINWFDNISLIGFFLFLNYFNLQIENILEEKNERKTLNTQISAPSASQILTCSPIPKMKTTFLKSYSATNNDVINRNMDQFHKKANESHYSETYCCCHGNLLEFFSIRFGASFNQPN